MGLSVVERRKDGKLHPVGGRLPEADHQRAVNITHTLRCRDGASFRAIVRALGEAGIRASLGSVHAWARGYSCPFCGG
jgi:hypothetical protein